MNKIANGILIIGGIAGAGALCFFTGGLAAPVIGSAIGSTFMGLSGAAATSAGLAALGGGSLAIGGAGMAGGTALISGVAAGLGATGASVGAALHSGAKAKRDNKDLTAKYIDICKQEKSKQAIIKRDQVEIEKLKTKISALSKKASDYEEKFNDLMQQIQYWEEMISDEQESE
jgi:hypothetical protein